MDCDTTTATIIFHGAAAAYLNLHNFKSVLLTMCIADDD
jgi:hypothetical protein